MTDILSDSVLVLNKNFYALCVIDVREAFRLIAASKALVMDENYIGHDMDSWNMYTDESKHRLIRTVNAVYAAPEVIRLTSFDKIVEYTLNATRQNVLSRDNYICQYCKTQISKENLTIDHVIPRSRREEFNLTPQQLEDWGNVVAACQICNSIKDNKTPEEANMPLVKLPAKPKYNVDGFEMRLVRPIWKLYLRMEE